MAVDKIKPFNDPRVQLRSTVLNGLTYGYLYSEPLPSVVRRGTVLLVHGFPDLSFGWRYQIPFLTSLGLTVIAPDCVGYGRTDSPRHTLSDYGYKRAADDLATLCQQLDLAQIVLGGHDWGSAVAWRMTQYYPKLVKALFIFGAPYFPPSSRFEPLASIIGNYLPQLAYQAQLVSGEIEDRVQSRAEIRKFLSAVFGALNTAQPNRLAGFDVHSGANLDLILSGAIPANDDGLVSSVELDFYASEFSRNGLTGPVNWYRIREVNWADEYAYFFDNGKVPRPSNLRFGPEHEILYVRATCDPAISDNMVARMVPKVDKLTHHEIEAGHWVLWQKPAEANRILGQWLEDKVFKEGHLSSKL
ncbi:uncharacterized protein Z520_03466 [Fonsecaea multimorphosa CBS 102226]|uniref:AB hydrolase-1 domain-containing protein n=1 Tax=Fonsecaea multimorphosa CBS 102226 TaxID=1442371 RepID=A0A0D2KCE1_9EURO|nr:uncharacterized protein Z520_03466 [Fonsecaea multimorphosa CBS 102226]KIY00800.1 hypothetical protein Z520_03466 [Fonsecaea multimorphosa CBS 102226]OAL27899.1 hypothetical protein AYO22_03244 [Fonsecaea multimorphosa]